MNHELPVAALQSSHRLNLSYDGEARQVEVHAVGYSTTGKWCMRVFQVGGGSVSGEHIGWKMMWLEKAKGMEVANDVSVAPREGYKRNDKHMVRILSQV